MKYRIKYVKRDNLIFISHLDILKVMQRAFRRSGIDLMHTQGFNPHPKIHFAPPLPLFTESLGEYVDVETVEDVSEQELLERLNESLPENLHMIQAENLEDNAKSLGKSLDCAVYEIKMNLEDSEGVDAEEITSFINNSDRVLIKKLNKRKKEVEKDIRPGILSFACSLNGRTLIINADLSMRSELIVSPNALISAINDRFPKTRNCESVRLLKKDTILFP